MAEIILDCRKREMSCNTIGKIFGLKERAIWNRLQKIPEAKDFVKWTNVLVNAEEQRIVYEIELNNLRYTRGIYEKRDGDIKTYEVKTRLSAASGTD